MLYGILDHFYGIYLELNNFNNISNSNFKKLLRYVIIEYQFGRDLILEIKSIIQMTLALNLCKFTSPFPRAVELN